MQIELSDLKYVVEVLEGIETPTTGTQLREHDSLIKGTSTVVSAGFMRFVYDEQTGRVRIVAFGESVKLGRHSRSEQDARILEKWYLPWQQSLAAP
jgi:hypothetical protein